MCGLGACGFGFLWVVGLRFGGGLIIVCAFRVWLVEGLGFVGLLLL